MRRFHFFIVVKVTDARLHKPGSQDQVEPRARSADGTKTHSSFTMHTHPTVYSCPFLVFFCRFAVGPEPSRRAMALRLLLLLRFRLVLATTGVS